jgi:hypothetical protein
MSKNSAFDITNNTPNTMHPYEAALIAEVDARDADEAASHYLYSGYCCARSCRNLATELPCTITARLTTTTTTTTTTTHSKAAKAVVPPEAEASTHEPSIHPARPTTSPPPSQSETTLARPSDAAGNFPPADARPVIELPTDAPGNAANNKSSNVLTEVLPTTAVAELHACPVTEAKLNADWESERAGYEKREGEDEESWIDFADICILLIVPFVLFVVMPALTKLRRT